MIMKKDEKRRVAELYNQLKENKLDLKKLSLTDLKRVNEILDKKCESESDIGYNIALVSIPILQKEEYNL